MSTRVRLARAIAIGADIVQIGLFPFFAEGVVSPLNVVVDIIVAILLTCLVGWHFAFLPGFIIEGIPFVDLAPTWTIAAMIATRNKEQPAPREPKTAVVEEPKKLEDSKTS